MYRIKVDRRRHKRAGIFQDFLTNEHRDMDLSFSAADREFREEVQLFLREHLPLELAAKVHEGRKLAKSDMEAWHAILNARGWLANHWPVEWGGTGWTFIQKFI